jgi:60 kDa SS-A/Ro ribonucleoprotein
VADRIADESEIRCVNSSRTSTLAAYLNADLEVPQKIRTALHNAAEIAYGNISEMRGPVVIGLDTTGSMSSSVTGHRGRGATSKS